MNVENFPCVYCGADADEPCSEACRETLREQGETERVDRAIERALEKRDDQWQKWCESFAVSIHRELGELRDEIGKINATVGVIVTTGRETNERLSLVESRLGLDPAA